ERPRASESARHGPDEQGNAQTLGHALQRLLDALLLQGLDGDERSARADENLEGPERVHGGPRVWHDYPSLGKNSRQTRSPGVHSPPPTIPRPPCRSARGGWTAGPPSPRDAAGPWSSPPRPAAPSPTGRDRRGRPRGGHSRAAGACARDARGAWRA